MPPRPITGHHMHRPSLVYEGLGIHWIFAGTLRRLLIHICYGRDVSQGPAPVLLERPLEDGSSARSLGS